jgi:hypothetical protein
MKEFVKELISLTGVSQAYAVACWYMFRNTKNPQMEARNLAIKLKHKIYWEKNVQN